MIDIEEQLNELYSLHRACLEFKHGVLREHAPWKLYKPSQFVYAYFTFNSIYSFDWASSFEQKKLLEWQAEIDIQSNKEKQPSESKKFKGMVKTCFKILGNTAPKIFLSFLKECLSEIPNPDKELENIIPDSRITSEEAADFRTHFYEICHSKLTPSESRKVLKVLIEVLIFIYKVRNNIFHGEKSVINMMDEEQQRRLIIYRAILLATNELFFEAASEKIGWREPSINFKDRQRNPPLSLSTRDIKPFNEQFKIKIPNGILFYPCCGRDTYEPLVLFLNTISEFHFVDIHRIALPTLECGVQRQRPDADKLPKNVLSKYHRDKTKQLSQSIVKTAVEHEEYNYLRSAEILGLDCGSFAVHRRCQEWTLNTEPEKTIEIICHKIDGALALLQLDNIAVFFYRRDGIGEGGSGQWWFSPDLFNLLLDKLLDGGIIITDGSNYHPKHKNVPWDLLWKIKNMDREHTFTYKNRIFTYLGKGGQYYAPVYAWQIRQK